MDNYDMVSIDSNKISSSQTKASLKTEVAASTLTNTYMMTRSSKNTSANADLSSLSMPVKRRQVIIIDPEMIKKYKLRNGSKKAECIIAPYSFVKIALLVSLVSGTVFYIWKK